MPKAVEDFRLNVLHVLTLNGRNGEYGGPVRVARELCTELNSRGHSTYIFSGALKGSEPAPIPGLIENYVVVRPILRKLPMSSLWSWHLLSPLSKQIKNADIVHIHFARDLIPFLAAAISILNRKPFVTQSHGMIIPDGRVSTRLVDYLFTRRLINRSATNLVLTEHEFKSVVNLGIRSPCKVLPNGIAFHSNVEEKKEITNRIAFCSRLEKRKGVEKFVALAEYFRDSGLVFEVYGPDGGELRILFDLIESRKLFDTLEYKGSLSAKNVQAMLRDLDLLVLPSKNEPFPMIVLEALAVGTPVLIMPSCGLADKINKFNSNFVASTEDISGLIDSFSRQIIQRDRTSTSMQIMDFCKKEFNIATVTSQLIQVYKEVLRNEN
jgi:glycosyltransferase involved in cell wall biosynthesis